MIANAKESAPEQVEGENEPTIWEDEEEHYLEWKQISELTQPIKRYELNEGQVFRLHGEQSTNISVPEKEKVGKLTKKLLDHEGKTRKEYEEGR